MIYDSKKLQYVVPLDIPLENIVTLVNIYLLRM